MVCKFFDEKTESGTSVNEQLAEELHKLIIKNLKRRKVYARFKDNFLGSGFSGNGINIFKEQKCLIFTMCDGCFH